MPDNGKARTGSLSSLLFENPHEFGGCVGQACAATGYQIDVPWHIQLSYLDFFHPAALDLPPHAHARHDSHAHAHLHEALDALDRGHFDRHVQRCAMPRKELDHAPAEEGFHDVPPQIFFPPPCDIYFA